MPISGRSPDRFLPVSSVGVSTEYHQFATRAARRYGAAVVDAWARHGRGMAYPWRDRGDPVAAAERDQRVTRRERGAHGGEKLRGGRRQVGDRWVARSS